MISFIVPTKGRPSLAATLASIDLRGDDELFVIGPTTITDARAQMLPGTPYHDWGATERTLGMQAATQPYLAFMDDDDVYAPQMRTLLADAITRTPDRPVLFRLQYPDGHQIWRAPLLQQGNVSSQMILIPNDPAKLGSWQSGRRECDYDFLASMGWPISAIVWRTDVLCQCAGESHEA